MLSICYIYQERGPNKKKDDILLSPKNAPSTNHLPLNHHNQPKDISNNN